MKIIKEKIAQNVMARSMDEWIVLGLTVSVFMPMYITAAALLITLVYLWHRGAMTDVFRSVPQARALAAFVGLGAVVSLFRGNWPGLVVSVGLAVVSLAALYVRSIMTRPLLKKVIRTACVTSMFCLPVAVIQIATHSAADNRAAATFANTNYYAAIVEMMILLVVNQLLSEQNKQDRLLFYMALAANVAGLYLSGCRTSLAVLVVGIPMITLAHRRYRLTAYSLAAGAALLLFMQLAPNLLIVMRLGRSGHDLMVRQMIWDYALAGFSRTPILGRGPMGYMTLVTEIGAPFYVHSHNLTLDVLLNYGLVGAGLLGVYLAGVGRTLWMLFRTRVDVPVLSMAAALISAVAIHGLTDVTILSLQAGLLFALLIAGTGIYECDRVTQRQFSLRTAIFGVLSSDQPTEH
jgi:O-antigen ligase